MPTSKEEQAKAIKDYYLKNPEKVKERNRRYYLKNIKRELTPAEIMEYKTLCQKLKRTEFYRDWSGKSIDYKQSENKLPNHQTDYLHQAFLPPMLLLKDCQANVSFSNTITTEAIEKLIKHLELHKDVYPSILEIRSGD